MIWPFLKILPKRFLGIDIGTSSIKAVELSRWGERRKLENYGEIKTSALYEKPFRTFEKNTLLLSNQDVARAIKAIVKESKIRARQVILSIPDFSSFFTNFELPLMTKEELPEAIKNEARLHIPLPLGEVVLDWVIVEGETFDYKKEKEFNRFTPRFNGQGIDRKKLKILLVAVPNEVINQYRELAALAGLQLFALEAEAFGLLRSLVGEESKKQVIALIDIGSRSITCSIIDKGILKTSYSFDMAGNELTQVIAKSFNIDYKNAEDLKKKHGLLFTQDLNLEAEKNVKEVLLPLIDTILREIEKVSRNFYQQEKKEIEKIIIAGGGALLPGLSEYFQEHFKKEEYENLSHLNVSRACVIEIADPFSNIFCPPILENTLKNMGPAYAIAVGMALRGLE